MENGLYGNANTDFRKLTVRKLPLYLFDNGTYAGVGCGATVLGLLTGVNPYEICRSNKGKAHYGDRFIRDYLRKYEISSYKVTKCNLTSRAKRTDQELSAYIAPNNVLLTSQLLTKNEASWFVYWNGISYHNFELDRANFTALLNFPIISSYVLYNPKWANV